MLDNYAQAGVSRSEFLTIVHLARYQYESRSAECRPGVATVARQMGYSVRGLQKVLAGLEERGLLARRFRPGETTVYDFSGFSRAVLKLSTKGVNSSSGVNPSSPPGVNPSSPPGVNPSSGVGVNPSSPKEEKPRKKEEEEKKKEAAAGLPLASFCSIHNVAMKLHRKNGDEWYSHRLPDGSWCKGVTSDQPGQGRRQSKAERERYANWGEN